MKESILYTLGSNGKCARTFFNPIQGCGIKTIIDVRLRNTSHLLGFTAVKHLPYLLQEVCGWTYRHEPLLAPTDALLDPYVSEKRIDWNKYQQQFRAILQSRQVETLFSEHELKSACLLCSEIDAATCHRSLVASYLQRKGVVTKVVHL